jgi:hypothetical protein
MTIEMEGRSRVARRKNIAGTFPLNVYLAKTCPAGRPIRMFTNVTKMATIREFNIAGYTKVPLIVYMD